MEHPQGPGRDRDFANLPTHLDATEALFPDNPVLAFDRGWQSEAHATHLLQTHARALVQAAAAKLNRRPRLLCATRAIFCDSDGNPYGIKNERESLIDAERRFAGAVRLDPEMAEAHVRLARVRTLLGRHAEAEATLQNLPPSNDDTVTFYAALAHGLALDALERLDEAAAAYDRALALFPHAQSANLAMSLVEQRRGNTARSAEFAKRGITPSTNDATALDPFERYRYDRGRNVTDAWAIFYAGLERPR